MRNIKEFLDAWFAAKPTKEARNDIAVDDHAEMVAAMIAVARKHFAAKAAV